MTQLSIRVVDLDYHCNWRLVSNIDDKSNMAFLCNAAQSPPSSAGITTAGLISYFIYYVFQTPFLFIPTQKLK